MNPSAADPSHLTLPTAAARRAAANRRANVAALHRTQPTFRFPADPDDASVEWVFGRDGSLTTITEAGWLGGSSAPARAAAGQLRTLDARGPVACFLAPPHAAHLRLALDRSDVTQAVVALMPDDAELHLLLACEDFSADVAAHRLFLVAGESWPADLAALFADRPGLPVPTQFVRVAGPDAAALDPVIAEAQRVFAAVGAERAETAKRIASAWRPAARERPVLAVATGSRFRLWDDAGLALAELVAAGGPDADLRGVCGDDPLSASTLALLRAAAGADAVLTADVARSDVPNLLPVDQPWVTWVTTPRIPSAQGAGPNDRLIVVDPAWIAAAQSLGWPAKSVTAGDWPAVAATTAAPPDDPPHVAVIADVKPLEPPERLEEFSSHRLLWNAIAKELAANPAAAGTDADAYLRSRQQDFGVADAALDRPLFVRGLVEPAAATAVVRKLVADGVAVRVYGSGWSDVDRLSADAVGGPIRSRAELAAAARRAAALIDVRPAAWRNGLWSLGRPVVRTAGRTHLAIRQAIAAATAGRSAAERPGLPITASRVLTLVARTARRP